jgi:hypothetical protein
LRLEVPADPAKQTKIDREFLMTTKEIDKYLEERDQKARQEGREEGRDAGLAQAVLAAYGIRFGVAPPAALVAAVEGASDHAALQRLHALVITHSAEDVVTALRRPRTKPPARAVAKRRSAAPRRAAVSR